MSADGKADRLDLVGEAGEWLTGAYKEAGFTLDEAVASFTERDGPGSGNGVMLFGMLSIEIAEVKEDWQVCWVSFAGEEIKAGRTPVLMWRRPGGHWRLSVQAALPGFPGAGPKKRDWVIATFEDGEATCWLAAALQVVSSRPAVLKSMGLAAPSPGNS